MASNWIVALLLASYLPSIEASTGKDLIYKKKNFSDRNLLHVEKAQPVDQYRHRPVTEIATHQTCHLDVNHGDAIYFRNWVENFKFNFANIRIQFVGNFTVNQTKDVILPYQWVWTYFTPGGYFPYLKWPVDFPVLSLGLLAIKTLHPKRGVFTINITAQGNCSLTLGSLYTTNKLGYAFQNMTQTYLVPVHAREFASSYWCYTKEVPRVKNTMAYKLGIHFNFPVEFSRYNCCRTRCNLYSSDCSKLKMVCIDQIPRMYQTVIIPYIAALLVFAYFPILLFAFAGLAVSQRRTRSRHSIQSYYTEDDDDDWVFLDGKSPIYFTYLITSFCGLGDRHPVIASRLRRMLLLFITPGIVYLHIFIYWKMMPDQTIAFLEHGKPLGFVSLLGGLRESMHNFAPMLGGPPCLLAVYYVAGLIFLIVPKDLNTIIQRGTDRFSQYDTISPLFYSEDTLVDLSGVKLHTYFGYSKVAAACRAGVYTLTNYKFWVSSISLQINRIRGIFAHRKSLCYIVLACFIPLYAILCVTELVACVVLYGVPVITSICILVKGFACTLNVMFEKRNWMEYTRLTEVVGVNILKVTIWIICSCLFLYFVISVSTIMVSIFHFLCELVVFCFISVIVYPFVAFGYIFFSCIILYYISKQLEHFGDGYFDLLSIAVEICSQMEEETFYVRIENDSLVINKTNGSKISKLRVQTHTINLSTDQRNQIQRIHSGHQRRICCKDDTVGIPIQLFEDLVKYFRPVHVQIFHTMLGILFIILLVAGTVSLVLVKPFGPTEELAEILHFIFIIAIGALPKILEIAIDKRNHATAAEIKRRKIKALIVEYWMKMDAKLNSHVDQN